MITTHHGFDRAYAAQLSWLMMHGQTAGPRGKMTRELLAVRITCDPTRPLSSRPGWPERFALTETLQVIAGRGDMRQLQELAPAFPRMAPTYVTYGPRLAWQLGRIHELLVADPATRQAVATIHEPQDLGKGYPDQPCTTTLQFLLRPADRPVPSPRVPGDEQPVLHLIATMRSNDAWLGLPTDVYMFTMLQREMATALGVLPGTYHHQVGSLHLYERHWEPALAWTEAWDAEHAPSPRGALPGYGVPGQIGPSGFWAPVREAAIAWLDGTTVEPWSSWLG